MAANRGGDGRGETGAARFPEAVLRARYETLWQDVQRELAKHRAEQYPDLVRQPADPEDRGQADLLVDLDLAEIDRDVEELRAIQRAFERVKRGTYGTCSSCGEAIDPQRLEALPHAERCIDCQARAESNVVATPSL